MIYRRSLLGGVFLFRRKEGWRGWRYTQFGVSDASVSAGRAEPIDELDAYNMTTIFF
jgi:hypothetical protein